MLSALRQLLANGPKVEGCLESIVGYVRRSIDASPPMMRDPGDACRFTLELLRLHREHRGLNVAHLLPDEDELSRLCEGASERQQMQVYHAMRRVSNVSAEC